VRTASCGRSSARLVGSAKVTSPMSAEDCVLSLVFFHSVRRVSRAVTISVSNVRGHRKLDLVILRWAVPELQDVARCCIIGSPDFLGIVVTGLECRGKAVTCGQFGLRTNQVTGAQGPQENCDRDLRMRIRSIRSSAESRGTTPQVEACGPGAGAIHWRSGRGGSRWLTGAVSSQGGSGSWACSMRARSNRPITESGAWKTVLAG
jgi:hypothetical protein